MAIMILPGTGRGTAREASGGGGSPRTLRRPEVDAARHARRAMSLPEALLWQRLKGAPLGISFRKQHPIDPYRADFYCAAAKLVIEVDGIAHDMGNRPQRDEKRTAVLEQQGYTILRLPAAGILRDPDEVAASVIAFARSSPGRGGGPPPQAVVEGAADARNDPPVDRPLHHASGMVPLPTSGEDQGA